MHRNLLVYPNCIKNMFTGNIFWPSTIGQTVYLEASCVDRQDRLPGLSFYRVYNLARKIQSPKRLVQLHNHSMMDVMRTKMQEEYDTVEKEVAVTWKHMPWKPGPMSLPALEVYSWPEKPLFLAGLQAWKMSLADPPLS